jgi:hypothetical protein
MMTVAVRSLIYLLIFLAAIAIGDLLVPNHPPARPVNISWDDVLFCFSATFVVSFLFEMNSLLGQNVLLSFVTGRYHRPKVEQRVFLIMDIQLPFFRKMLLILHIPPHREGRIAIVTTREAGMRWTLWRRARLCRADERRRGGRRSRVVLASRR